VLGILARTAAQRYAHAFRMDKVPVTALAATVFKARLLQVGNQLSNLARHVSINSVSPQEKCLNGARRQSESANRNPNSAHAAQNPQDRSRLPAKSRCTWRLKGIISWVGALAFVCHAQAAELRYPEVNGMQFNFTLDCETNGIYLIEQSTNLVDWRVVARNAELTTNRFVSCSNNFPGGEHYAFVRARRTNEPLFQFVMAAKRGHHDERAKPSDGQLRFRHKFVVQ
jgi:hypothetical protein